MPPNPTIVFTLEAQANTQSAFRSARDDIDSLGAKAGEHTPKLKAMGDALEKSHSQSEQFSEGLKGLGLNLNEVATAATVVGGIFAGVEFFKGSVESAQELSNQIFKVREQLGGTAEDASRLRTALDDTGVSVEGGTKALDRFSKALAGASQDSDGLVIPAGMVAKTIKSLGIETEDANGKLLPMSVILPQLSDRFRSMPDGVEKTALAMTLFGKSGAELLPFLNQGAEGLKKLSEESDKYGLTLSDKQLNRMRAFALEQRAMNSEIEGMKLQLTMEAMPAMEAAFGFMQDSIATVHEIGDALGGMGDAFHNMADDLGKISPPLKDFFDLIDRAPKPPDWLAGVLRDAAIGAAIGTVVPLPGVGTVSGAIAGAAVGAGAAAAGHASGGMASGVFVVGEEGPEVLFSQAPVAILSNDRSRAMGLLGHGVPGFRSGTGNSIADDIAGWADAHDGLGGLSARQLAEVLITGAAYETDLTDANNWPYAGGPFSFDDTSPGYPHGGGPGGTWSAATRLGYDVHSASSSLDYFLAHDQLASAAAAIKADLDAGVAMASASFEYEHLVERPDADTVASRGGGAWAGAAAIAHRMVAAAYAQAAAAAAAPAAAAAAAPVTAPGVGASNASQGVIGVGGDGGAPAGSSPGGNPDNPDILGGAGATGAPPQATPGGAAPVLGSSIVGSTTTAPPESGITGPLPPGTVVLPPNADQYPGIGAAAILGPGPGRPAIGGGVSSNAAGAAAVVPGVAGPPPPPPWAILQGDIDAILHPNAPATLLHEAAKAIAQAIESGDEGGAVTLLSRISADNFDKVVSEAKAIIEADAKAAGTDATKLDEVLGRAALAAAPSAAKNLTPPATDFARRQADIDAVLDPTAPKSLQHSAAVKIAAAIESGNIGGAVAILAQLGRNNFDATLAEAKSIIDADVKQAGGDVSAAEGQLVTAAATAAPLAAKNRIVAADPAEDRKQIDAILQPNADTSLVYLRAKAVAYAINRGNTAAAIRILSGTPRDQYDAVVAEAESQITSAAKQDGVSADALTGLLNDAESAAIAAAPAAAKNLPIEAPDFSGLQATIDATLHPNLSASKIHDAGLAVAIAIESGDTARAVALLVQVPADNYFAVVSAAEADLAREAKLAGLTTDQLNSRLQALAGIETQGAQGSAANRLPAYSDKPPVYGAPPGGVPSPSLAFGANAAAATTAAAAATTAAPAANTAATSATGPVTAPSTQTQTGAATHAVGTSAGGGMSITFNIDNVPTSSTDPAVGPLVRAIDEFLKRTGHPAGLGAG